MMITVIYGTERKSSTYNIAKQFIRNLSKSQKVDEFYLPRDCPNYCRGCFKCFDDNTKCPDYNYIEPILNSILKADLIIFTSPVYVFHVTGQMKTLLDHFGFQWLVHKPNKSMFNKQALIISTAAGGGTKQTVNDIKDSLEFWGIAQIYEYRKNVAAINWTGVSDKKKSIIKKEVLRLSARIKKDSKHILPSLKVQIMFYAIRFMYKYFPLSNSDLLYWKSSNLLKSKPW